MKRGVILPILYILFLSIIIQSTNAMTISEIVYNPVPSDSYNEWIELYNPSGTEINIENWSICGRELLAGYINRSGELYSNNGTIIPAGGFAVVTDGGSGTEVYDNFNVNTSSIALHVDASSMCGGLANTHDLISLIDGDEDLIDAVSYWREWGAHENHQSLCKIPEETGLWLECTQTPGSTNGNFYDFANVRLSEFLPNPIGYDNAPMPDGEWIELFNYGTKELDLTDVKLKDNAGHTIIVSSTTTFNQTIQPSDYLVVYTNGFSGFLNNEGFEKIELYDPNNNLIEEVSYSFSEEGNSWSKLDNWIITKPTPGEENYKEEQEKESIIEIENIYLGSDNKARFGDNLRVKVSIYKGDTTKTSVEAYIEKDNKKISKTTKFNIEKKYSDTTLTIPIQIFPNCELKEPEGKYKIKVEGFETKDYEEIKIEGVTDSLCEKQEVIKETIKEEITASENIINEAEVQTPKEQIKYESVSEKSNKSAVYFFCIALILILTKKWKK